MQYVMHQCAVERLKAVHQLRMQQLDTGVITGVVTHHGMFMKIRCNKLITLIR
jgi:hypothetical protein